MEKGADVVDLHGFAGHGRIHHHLRSPCTHLTITRHTTAEGHRTIQAREAQPHAASLAPVELLHPPRF